MKHRKSLETYLFSTVGVAALLVLLVAVNYLASFTRVRLDLTADKAFTLSAGTRAILSRLETPVQVRLYVTRDDNTMPVFLRTYARRVEDLLEEYRQVSKGLVEIQKLDPQPDSDAEDSARLDGIEGQLLQTGEQVYLGLSVSLLDQKQAIPFLSPSRERLLEYDISRAIARVLKPQKPVIGVMSPLPVAGMMSPVLLQMGGGGREPWVFYSELQRDFEVKQVEMTASEIPADIQVLVVIHPRGITDTAQFAIDQFVLRGGKLIAFLDPLCLLDAQSRMGFGAPPSSSSLDKLLKAWGLEFDTGQVVADLTYLGRSRNGREPGALALNETAFDKGDIVTGDADNAFFVFGGAFTGNPADGLTLTTLMHSSKESQLVDPMLAQTAGERVIQNFQPSGVEYRLAVRLAGKFKTAFPDGRPKAPGADSTQPKEEQAKSEATALKESTEPGTVLLFGDADMIQDGIATTEIQNPFGGQRLVMPANGNLAIAQSAVEQLAGDSDLIAVRGRAVRERPFTVVRDMQAQAEARFREQIQSLENSLAETQQRLSQLQHAKEKGQKFILSPEQQQELAKFREQEAQVKKNLKNVRRNLRAEVEALETRLKWLNIAAMPALVTTAGLVLGYLRRKRAAAR